MMQVMDEVAVPLKLREEVQKFYPNARLGLLKSGGNFPYLSRADEVNMLIEVHTHNPHKFNVKGIDHLMLIV
jgi:maspardin